MIGSVSQAYSTPGVVGGVALDRPLTIWVERLLLPSLCHVNDMSPGTPALWPGGQTQRGAVAGSERRRRRSHRRPPTVIPAA